MKAQMWVEWMAALSWFVWRTQLWSFFVLFGQEASLKALVVTSLLFLVPFAVALSFQRRIVQGHW